MTNRNRLHVFVAMFLLIVGILWPLDNQKKVEPGEWATTVKTTKDIAILDWNLRFKLDAAPSTPFAYIASHGRDLLHGFHLTVDLYGNGYLNFVDTSSSTRVSQFVWLGHPIIGEHTLKMRFEQSDRKIEWRKVEIFFNGEEINFHSGTPEKVLKLEDIEFVPDNYVSPAQSDAPFVGEILDQSLTLTTWKASQMSLTQIVLLFVGLLLLGISIAKIREQPLSRQ